MALPSHLISFWDDLKNGTACASRRDFDGAIRCFTKVLLELDLEVHCPRGAEPPYAVYCQARLERGLAYWLNNKAHEAIDDFTTLIKEASIARCPKSLIVRAYLHRGILYANAGDASLACTDFRQALALDPSLTEASLRLRLAETELLARSKDAHVTFPDTRCATINSEVPLT